MPEPIIVKSGQGETGGQPGGSAPPIITPPAPDAGVKPSYSDDTEFELEGGEKITLKELKSGNLRQKDYTQKTQELSKEKDRLADFEALSTWINDPANKDKAEQVLAILEGKELPAGGADDLDPNDPRDKRVLDLMKKVDGFESETKTERQARATQSVEDEIAQTKAKYKDMSDEEMDDILSIVQGKGGKENIVKTADRYFDRLGKRDKTTIKNYLEGKEQGGKRPILPVGGAAPARPGTKLSLEDGSAKRSLIESLKAGMTAANE